MLRAAGGQTPRGTARERLDARDAALASGPGHSAQGGEGTQAGPTSALPTTCPVHLSLSFRTENEQCRERPREPTESAGILEPRALHALFLPITRCRLVWMLRKLQVVDPWLAASSQNGTTPLCGLRWGSSPEGGRGALTASACNRTALGDSGEMLHLPASSQTSAQQSPAQPPVLLPGLSPHFCQVKAALRGKPGICWPCSWAGPWSSQASAPPPPGQ